MSLSRALPGKKVVVFLGAGGVGKTTSSAAYALQAAKEGQTVALLSIDPAKRLADALGISLGQQLSEVKVDEQTNEQTGGEMQGQLFACMLDQKAVFDDMVRRFSRTEEATQKILQHPLYVASSTSLSGPLEYTALAKLVDLVNDSRFDLVVLDTPPDTHALDFLQRPNILAGFMDQKVMTWLLKPLNLANRFGLSKLMDAGSRLFSGVGKVAGMGALRAVGDYILLIQEVIEGFHMTGKRVQEILQSSDTAFVLVSIPTSAAFRSASFLGDALVKMQFPLTAVLLNRTLPRDVAHALKESGTAVKETALMRRLDCEEQISRELSERFAASNLSETQSLRFIRVEDRAAVGEGLDGLLGMVGRVQ